MRRTLRSLLLAATYLAVVGQIEIADLAVALGLGAALSALGLRRRRRNPWTPARLRSLPGLLAAMCAGLGRGAWQMTAVLVGRRTWRHAGLVNVPTGRRSARGQVFSAFAVGTSPGSILLDVDPDRRRFIVSVIDARAPGRIRARLDDFYDAAQRRVIP